MYPFDIAEFFRNYLKTLDDVNYKWKEEFYIWDLLNSSESNIQFTFRELPKI